MIDYTTGRMPQVVYACVRTAHIPHQAAAHGVDDLSLLVGKQVRVAVLVYVWPARAYVGHVDTNHAVSQRPDQRCRLTSLDTCCLLVFDLFSLVYFYRIYSLT